jgi:integrase
MKLINYPKTKTAKGWKVEIPATLAGGKRRREFFKTREEANKRVSDLNNEIQNFGSGASQIAPQHYHDAVNAIALLEGTDMTLTQVVESWLKHLSKIKESITLVELAQRYVDNPNRRKPISHRAYNDYLNKAKKVGSHFPEKFTHDITADDIQKVINELPEGSVTSYKRILNAMFKWGSLSPQGFHDGNVIAEVEAYRTIKDKPEVLTNEDIESLLNSAKDELKGRYLPYYILSIFGGLRRSEVSRITWDDIDLKRKHIYISPKVSKTNASRYVELMPNVIKWLELCDQREPILTVPTKRQKIIRDKAKLTNWQRNIMRHTACSFFYAYHQDEGRLTNWAGHGLAVFLSHYKNAVIKEDAIKFWSITPGGQPTQLLQSVI